MYRINNVIERCIDCPFHKIMGMEKMMYCAHPSHVTLEQSAIINQDNKLGVPDECPLRLGAVIKTIRLKE